MRREPPRLAERILRRFLPAGKRGASILGDLHEEFHALRSDRLAALWYWAHAISVSLPYAPCTILISRRAIAMAHDLRGDLRAAIRLFSRTPTTSAIIVFTLALAIGAATIGFAFADLALFRGLPVDDTNKVVSVFASDTHGSNPRARVSAPDLIDYRARATRIEHLAGMRMGSVPLIRNGQSQTLTASYATANVFTAMGQRALVGRVFMEGEDRPGAAPVVILAHHYWRDEMLGRDDAIGRTLQLGRNLFTVIGVMPP